MEAAYFDKRFNAESAQPLGLAFARFREFDDQLGERHGCRIGAVY
jgi:hypothetical protein